MSLARRLTPLLLATLTLLALAGCGTEEDWIEEDEGTEAQTIAPEEELGTTALELRLNQLPFGMIVGACYPNQDACARYQRAGTAFRHIGDMGQAGGRGWSFVYVSTTNPGLNLRNLNVPIHSACGFTKNNGASGFNCAGHNPARSCPAGFTRRQASDRGGSTWHWCGYLGDGADGATGLTRLFDITRPQPGLNCGGETMLGPYDRGRRAGEGLLACLRR